MQREAETSAIYILYHMCSQPEPLVIPPLPFLWFFLHHLICICGGVVHRLHLPSCSCCYILALVAFNFLIIGLLLSHTAS